MATVTYTLGSSGDETGTISWEVDYDDQSFMTTALRCINNTSRPGSGQVWDIPETRRFPPTGPRITPAHTTEERVIPPQAALILDVVDHRGRMIPQNLDGAFNWPV